jgi:transcriptional regulator of aromatic amino acid metabolism
MLRICAWCKKHLEETVDEQGHEITHGICESCRVTMLCSHAPSTLNKFLSCFSLPVMMVDGDGRVVSANQAALNVVGKELEEVAGDLGGNVMSCKFAYQEGGCGETVHCIACTIRNNVIETHKSGESLHQVPAHLEVEQDGQEMTLNFLISTEKVGDAVLLRIDKMV